MTDKTPLDIAHAAMMADENDEIARLRFYERIADVELFLLLESEPEVDQINPVLLDDAYVMVFDRIERLAAYVGQPAPYVALSGRAIAGMLKGQTLGMAVNMNTAPSAILLPDTAIAWLRNTLANEAQQVQTGIERVISPKGLPEALITALDSKLAVAGAGICWAL